MSTLALLDPEKTRPARQRMIQSQLIRRGISNARVLAALQEIPREHFVPVESIDSAYLDGPLAIGQGQTISQPYMVAVMSELLQLDGTQTVLEIGAGSGYGAAILSRLAHRVIAVERIPALLQEAQKRWLSLGLHNIEGIAGDGSLGSPEHAPFDGISVTAAAPEIPTTLVHQLRVETGCLVIPVGSRFSQVLQSVSRARDGTTRITEHFACTFVPLLGKYGWQNDPV